MAASKIYVQYSPSAVIEVNDITDLKPRDAEIKVVGGGNIPQNKPFVLQVELPFVEPDNVLPVGGKKYKFRLFLQAFVYDIGAAGTLAANTPMMAGIPLNNPQRMKKHKRDNPHQMFQFAAMNFMDGSHTARVHLRSMHKFFESKASGIDFAHRQSVVKDVHLPVG